MAQPIYTIGRNEMLIIKVRWDDVDVLILEAAVHCYTAEEVQELIDEVVTPSRTVIGVDRYDMVRRVGEDISEDLDIRNWLDRQEDERAEEAEDETHAQRVYSSLRDVSTLNHSQQGISQVAMFKPRAGLNADLVRGASFL